MPQVNGKEGGSSIVQICLEEWTFCVAVRNSQRSTSQKCGQRLEGLWPRPPRLHGTAHSLTVGIRLSYLTLFNIKPVGSKLLASRSGLLRNQRARTLRRGLATEATLESHSDVSSEPPLDSAPRTLPYKLYTSLILARSPFLTPTPTPLESAYYAYQSRIQRALSTPFPSEFYFKKGSLLERRFLAEERARDAQAFGEEFEPEEGAERVEDVPSEEDDIKILPRETEADRKGDVKDLNRMGDRTLYLLVKANEPGTATGQGWRFPYWEAGVTQPLHKVSELFRFYKSSMFLLFGVKPQTVQEGLITSFGPNMNTWIVGRQPIAFTEDADTSKVCPIPLSKDVHLDLLNAFSSHPQPSIDVLSQGSCARGPSYHLSFGKVQHLRPGVGDQRRDSTEGGAGLLGERS